MFAVQLVTIQHCLIENEYDTAPQHLLPLTLDVVLPGNPKIHLDVTLDDVNCASASLCYLRATILIMRYARALLYPYHSWDRPMVRSLCYLRPLYSSPLAHHGGGPLHLSAVRGQQRSPVWYGICMTWNFTERALKTFPHYTKNLI